MQATVLGDPQGVVLAQLGRAARPGARSLRFAASGRSSPSRRIATGAPRRVVEQLLRAGLGGGAGAAQRGVLRRGGAATAGSAAEQDRDGGDADDEGGEGPRLLHVDSRWSQAI